ncbi:MAG: fatty acid desaturase [Oligoflexia bacterium]|nr:fatty acid desaturase [Oligoflexia bacterium]
MDFIKVSYPQPHPARGKQLMSTHPEVRELAGPHPMSAVWVIGVVIAQTALALYMAHQPWWVILLVAYFVGAFANHAMWIMIHEASHNLIFKGTAANQAIAIFANLVLFFPSAISFKKYHLLHHRYQGEMKRDADLGWEWEASWVGNSTWRKAVYLAFFFLVQGVFRPFRIEGVKPLCRWVVANIIIEFAFLGALYYFAGIGAPLYLFLSLVFAVGLHPVGARWIQEHYVFTPGQETYSYYGSYNRLGGFNIGYHNEHHDIPVVAWKNLPKVKALAPELYDTLYSHSSYTKLLWQYLTRKDVSPYNRVIRGNIS